MSAPPRLLSRERLLACILINQLATPGLGSLMARRFISGSGQLIVALAGFGMVLVWMARFFWGVVAERLDRPAPPIPDAWIWKWGLVVFGASWLWALVTSCGLWLQLRRLDRSEAGALRGN